MEEVKVSAKVDVAGLEEAVNRFGRFSGSVSDTERAFKQIGITAQDAVRAGGLVTPDQMEKMTRNLDTLKRAEGELTRQLEEKKKALADILQQAESSPVVRALVQQGVPLHEAIKASVQGVGGRVIGGVAAGSQDIPGIEKEIANLEARLAKVQEGLPQAEMLANAIGTKIEGALDRWLPKFGSVLRTTLGIVGVGGAAAIVASMRQEAVQFYPQAADVAAFLGRRGRGIGETALRARGPYGLYHEEALRIGRSIGAAGGTVSEDAIREFAGMGLVSGLGREGFAQMGAEAVGSGRFQGFPQFRQFGRTAIGMAESYGLGPAQRTFYLESNKNLIEQMTTWYGGRPLSVESYFQAMNSLMMALRGSGLPMAGAPVAMDIARSIGGGLAPTGKPMTENLRTAALLGIPMEEIEKYGLGPAGANVAIQRRMLDRGPVGILQDLARSHGIQGTPTPGQYTQLRGIADLIPGMGRALDLITQAAGPGQTPAQMIGRVLTEGERALPKETIAEATKALLEEAGKDAKETWRDMQTEWRASLTYWGKTVTEFEAAVKSFGPVPTAIISALGGTFAGSFLGTALGSSIGGIGSKGVGAILPFLRKAAPWAALLTAPFMFSGESMGTRPPRSTWEGPPPTKEEFIEMERMAKEGKFQPFQSDSLVTELIRTLSAMLSVLERSASATESNTKALEAPPKQSALPEPRRYQPARPGPPRG